MLDYFYGGQADLFSFYRLPKALFVDPRFRAVSADSKIWENEDMRMLFSLAKDASPEDLRQAVKIIKALRGND